MKLETYVGWDFLGNSFCSFTRLALARFIREHRKHREHGYRAIRLANGFRLIKPSGARMDVEDLDSI